MSSSTLQVCQEYNEIAWSNSSRKSWSILLYNFNIPHLASAWIKMILHKDMHNINSGMPLLNVIVTQMHDVFIIFHFQDKDKHINRIIYCPFRSHKLSNKRWNNFIILLLILLFYGDFSGYVVLNHILIRYMLGSILYTCYKV